MTIPACHGRRGHRHLFALLALTALWLPPPLFSAAPPEALIVIAADNATHAEVVSALRASLGDNADRKLTLRTRTLADPVPAVPRVAPMPALVVTVGTEAANAVLAEHPPVPLLCVLLPEASHRQLMDRHHDPAHAPVSGLLLDQPFARQLRLIRLALPQAGRVGVVLGPVSRRQEPALRQAAAGAGLVLQTAVINGERELIGTLHRLLEESDILLAVPDPVVFNRHTAQNVLLTANGRGKPVAGFSRAYVEAGALFAVYSTPAQIGQQAGELLQRFAENRRLPATQAPRYFSVEVNERVARSLGLNVADKQTLTRRLMEAARERTP
jgi:ABC-type uncharacterized transport system substrate-binding protein